MLQEMDQSEFGQFVAALWERQGWQTQVKRDDGRVFVAAQRPQSGEEGLLWAIADGSEVGGKQVQQFSSLCQQYEVEEAAIVTSGIVSDHAQKVASESGVELLDGDGVTTLVEKKGLTDLVEQYADGGGGSATEDADDSGVGQQLQAVFGNVFETVEQVGVSDFPVSRTAVVAVVAVVALVAAGVLVGPSIPFLGGNDAPISAESTTPEGSATTLSVSWNAKVVDSIDPNESDGAAYYPPPGEQFVLVRLSIDNTGEQKAKLRQAAFRLRTDEKTYGHQLLADHDGFMDFPISPGQHYMGWTVFSVPKGTTGTLVYDQNATSSTVAVEFERDPSIPVTVTQQ